MRHHRTARAAAALWLCALAAPAVSHAAFTLADIDLWTGSPPGTDVHEAALVIDFAHPGAPFGAPSLAWGYRWPATESRTGQDMIAAVVAADPRLRATGLEFGFIETLSYDTDLNGSIDFTHPGFDPGSGRYSVYWVNNAVIEGTPPLFADAAHVLPPNGNPFAAESAGAWVFSSTGMAGRPLADGSWDGWVYANESLNGPREPVAAPVPEPDSVALIIVAGVLACRRRGRPCHGPHAS